MNRRWQDLSGRQRRVIGVLAVIQFTLLGAALIDLQRRPDERVNGSKRLWRAAAFINFAGPIAYFAFGRKPRA